MEHSPFGYSAVSTFEQCPYRYKLQYIDQLKTLPSDDPANALIIGTALHKAIETDIDTAIEEYFNSYPIIDNLHINEEIKLRYLIPKVKAILPQGTHEVQVIDRNFIGTLDLLVPLKPEDMSLEEKDEICFRCPNGTAECDYCNSGHCPLGKYEGFYDLYDFKYSNNWMRYMDSRQLHLYKYYFEKKNPGKKIRNMYFVFVPKVQIRQKKTEDLHQFRQRLLKELDKVSIKVEQVHYDTQKVIDHLELTQVIPQVTEYSKNHTRLCDWCEFRKFCQEGEVFEMLPSTNRVTMNFGQHKKIWIYGPPFSGKTTVCDDAPTPLNLNTDGNVKGVTMPRLPITNTKEGRQTKLAWKVFEEAVEELEAGSDFETIVVDLLEDTYTACRLWMYDEKDIEHESDDLKTWDMVRTKYLSTIKRLMDLPYNIVVISHEDTTKDIFKKSNDKVTAIKPNIQDKVATKIAGMVDIVFRVVIEDDDTRWLSAKHDNVIFGGGRLKTKDGEKLPNKIPLSWNAIEDFYALVDGKNNAETHEAPTEVQEPTPTTNDAVDANDEVMEQLKTALANTETTEEPKRRTRRTRN